QHCKDAIFGFVGYGVERPRFVFIGPVEGSDNRLVNLEPREHFPAFHDRDAACHAIEAAYNGVGRHVEAQRYAKALEPSEEPTWTVAAKLVAGSRAPATAWEAEYANLGRRGQLRDTLLMELFPLPKQGTGCWPPQYIDEFAYANQNRYYDAVWPRNVQ